MIQLIKGDCLEVMKQIPTGSIDAIITDPPLRTINTIGFGIRLHLPILYNLKMCLQNAMKIFVFFIIKSQPTTHRWKLKKRKM